ncbi:MAG: hypothetical protein IKA79_07425 [Lentisphaeria bacterium]|nr:hypothetical protein [Lentisphaeria bacterium]
MLLKLFFLKYCLFHIYCLFPISAGLLFFSPDLFAAPVRHNNTVYVRPGREEIIKRLDSGRKISEKYPERDIVCTRQEITIEIYSDYSCKIAEAKEFYIRKKLTSFPCPLPEKFYVEQFFPGGFYKDANNPEKLFLPEKSLFILKSSRILPARKREEFFLELFIDHPFPVEKTYLTIAYTRNIRISHGMTPPYLGRLPLMKKLWQNSYILDAIKGWKSPAGDDRIRFYASGLSSWQELGKILSDRLKKKPLKIPVCPQPDSSFSPGRKLEYLFRKAKELQGDRTEKIRILLEWLSVQKIKAYPAMAKKEGKSIHMRVACDFFTVPLICVPEQKGFRSRVWLDLSADKPGQFCLKEDHIPVLLLENGTGAISFISGSEKKD